MITRLFFDITRKKVICQKILPVQVAIFGTQIQMMT